MSTGKWRVGDGHKEAVHAEIEGAGGTGGAAGRADSATDRDAARGASEPSEPVRAQGARGLEEVFKQGMARLGKRLEHVPYLSPAVLSVHSECLRQDMICTPPSGFHSTIRHRIPSTSVV